MKLSYILASLMLLFTLVACSTETMPATLKPQDFGTASNDYAIDVAAPRGGVGVVVVGETNGSLEGPNKGDYDAFIRKYDGAPVWASQYGTTTVDLATDVAVTSTGVSYVLGTTTGVLGLQVGAQDVYLRKFDTNGAVLWTRQFGTTGTDTSVDVTQDSSGNVYTLSIDSTANFRVRKFNDSGTLLLTISNNASVTPAALGVDSTGNIFVLTRVVTTSTYAKIYKYSSTGTRLASPNIYLSAGSNSLYICDLIVDSSDNLYVSLFDFASNKGGYIFKLNSALVKTWTKRVEPATTGRVSTPLALALDTTDNLYLAGYTTGSYTGFTNAGLYDIFVAKYSPAGARFWTRQIGAAGNDLTQGIAVSDAVYVTGYSNSDPNLLGDPGYGGDDAFLAQLNLVTGAVWGIDQ
jgi:Beta-propeller repeat